MLQFTTCTKLQVTDNDQLKERETEGITSLENRWSKYSHPDSICIKSKGKQLKNQT